MGLDKLYNSYEKDFEENFRVACKELAYYQGNRERTTLDCEWTEQELKDDIIEEAEKILKEWLPKHKDRAVKDKNLLKSESILTNICDRYDLIEVYNRAYDMHRNDKPIKFGIHYFDDVARLEINKILKQNLITS